MSSKLLMKLEGAHFLLQHHSAEQFPFLTDPANARNRTALTFTLARLLFMEDTPTKFKAFVAPMQQVGRSGIPQQDGGGRRGTSMMLPLGP